MEKAVEPRLARTSNPATNPPRPDGASVSARPNPDEDAKHDGPLAATGDSAGPPGPVASVAESVLPPVPGLPEDLPLPSDNWRRA